MLLVALMRAPNRGIKNVWIVTVADEIGNGKNDFMTYYIDKKDRKLWKQEINAAGRKMIMIRKEHL